MPPKTRQLNPKTKTKANTRTRTKKGGAAATVLDRVAQYVTEVASGLGPVALMNHIGKMGSYRHVSMMVHKFARIQDAFYNVYDDAHKAQDLIKDLTKPFPRNWEWNAGLTDDLFELLMLSTYTTQNPQNASGTTTSITSSEAVENAVRDALQNSTGSNEVELLKLLSLVHDAWAIARLLTITDELVTPTTTTTTTTTTGSTGDKRHKVVGFFEDGLVPVRISGAGADELVLAKYSPNGYPDGNGKIAYQDFEASVKKEDNERMFTGEMQVTLAKQTKQNNNSVLRRQSQSQSNANKANKAKNETMVVTVFPLTKIEIRGEKSYSVVNTDGRINADTFNGETARRDNKSNKELVKLEFKVDGKAFTSILQARRLFQMLRIESEEGGLSYEEVKKDMVPLHAFRLVDGSMSDFRGTISKHLIFPNSNGIGQWVKKRSAFVKSDYDKTNSITRSM